MKKIVVILILFSLLAGFAYASTIGIDLTLGIYSSSVGVGSSNDVVLWDASGDAVLWDATNDKVLWE